MASFTENYNLIKPGQEDIYNIGDFNDNADIIDAELKDRVLRTGDISNTQITTFDTITGEFPVPAAGETTRTVAGKIRKFIQDFNSFKTGILTVSMLVNNAVTNNSQLPVSAAVAKVLQDQVTKLNSDLTTVNTYTLTPSNFGIPLYYRTLGPCKSISAAGTHTVEWVAGTTYGVATVGGMWASSYSWSKRIVYKTSNVQHYAVLAMGTDGTLFITPETVGSGGTLRIHEVYF